MVSSKLRTYILKECKPCNTSAAVHFKKECHSAGESPSEEDRQRSQSIIGSLTDAVIGIRPDLSLGLNELSKHVSQPGNNRLVAAKRVHASFRELSGKRSHFSRQAVKSGEVEVIYCPTELMLADALTKALRESQVCKICNINFNSSHTTRSERDCR